MRPEGPWEALTASQEQAVVASIASGSIEGWQPTDADTGLLCRVASGAVTAADAADQIREEQTSRVHLLHNVSPGADRDWTAASWSDYLYAGTNVLINCLNIRDGRQLTRAEGILVAIRTVEAMTDSAALGRALDGMQLRILHRQLAQDLYPWAGHHRSVAIGKSWSQFAPVDTIEACVERAAVIVADTDWITCSATEFAEQIAAVYAWLNYAHPFRDLNGRTTRLFMDYIAAQANRTLDYSKVSGEVWIQRSAFTVPDQGQAQPQHGYMIPVFSAISAIHIK